MLPRYSKWNVQDKWENHRWCGAVEEQRHDHRHVQLAGIVGDFLLDPSFKLAYSFEPKLNLNAKIRQYTNAEIKFGL